MPGRPIVGPVQALEGGDVQKEVPPFLEVPQGRVEEGTSGFDVLEHIEENDDVVGIEEGRPLLEDVVVEVLAAPLAGVAQGL